MSTSHFTTSTNPLCWSSDCSEIEQVSFVNSYVNMLINNSVSYLTNETAAVNDVIPAKMYTAFICDVISYSECGVLLNFLSAKPITLVTFDVPQKQDHLPMTVHYLCTILNNIHHVQHIPFLIVLVGLHNGLRCDFLDDCKRLILQHVSDKSYRRLLADEPSSAVIFYQFGCCGVDCALKELIVDKVLKNCDMHLTSDHSDVLQRISETGVVAMTKKELKSVYKGGRSLKKLCEDGVVCYFNDCPSLQDVVFTSPQWLNNIITLLTNPPEASDSIECSNGVLTDKLVRDLLAQFTGGASTVINLSEAVMSLLVHFDLAVPQNNSDTGSSVLVPSLITSSCPPAILNTDTVFLFTIAGGNITKICSHQFLVRVLKWSLKECHQILRYSHLVQCIKQKYVYIFVCLLHFKGSHACRGQTTDLLHVLSAHKEGCSLILCVYILSVYSDGALLQMMITGHCYQLISHTANDVTLHLSQPHPPMSAEFVQQLTDKHLQLVQLLQLWWRELCGDKAVSGLMCPQSEHQPRLLDYKPSPLNDDKRVSPPVEKSVNEQLSSLSSQPHPPNDQPHLLDDQPHPPDDEPHPQCSEQLVRLSEYTVMLMRLGEHHCGGDHFVCYLLTCRSKEGEGLRCAR